MRNRFPAIERTAVALALLAGAAAVVPAARADAPPAQQPPQQPAQAKGDGNKSPAEKPDGPPVERASVTEHEITVSGGRRLRYRATAGTIVLRGDDGKPKADVYYTAYERLADAGARDAAAATTKPATTAPSTNRGLAAQPPVEDARTDAGADPSARPITYVFNGGPGAASVWLHLGTVGPKRVKLTPHGDVPPPPVGVEDNPATWLYATDLVFIDPVGTGFSRPAPGEKQEQFSGVQEDIAWVAEFIRLYTTRNGRWPSPKFLAGESYGTTRAAGLSDHLIDEHGIALNGIVFVSTVLNFQTISFGRGNETPYVLFLPTYTATAWYHKRLPDDLQKDLPAALKEVEQWAVDAYLPALAKGDKLSADERAELNKRLARYTGLPADVVAKAELRIDPSLFRSALLGDKRELAGRFDGRITGYNPDPLSRGADFDPSLSGYLAAYTSAFNQYVRRDLRYETDRRYEVLSGRVQPWNFGRAGSGYLDVAENLQEAMRKNPHMRVLFASGIYDLATPYFATNYTVNRLNLSPALRRNVTETFYEGGHMMYHYHPAMEQLQRDVQSFVARR